MRHAGGTFDIRTHGAPRRCQKSHATFSVKRRHSQVERSKRQGQRHELWQDVPDAAELAQQLNARVISNPTRPPKSIGKLESPNDDN